MRWVGLPCVPLTRTNHQTYTHTHLVLCLSVTKLTPHSPTCSRLDLSDLLHECIRRWTKKIKIFECDKMIIPINVSREWQTSSQIAKTYTPRTPLLFHSLILFLSTWLLSLLFERLPIALCCLLSHVHGYIVTRTVRLAPLSSPPLSLRIRMSIGFLRALISRRSAQRFGRFCTCMHFLVSVYRISFACLSCMCTPGWRQAQGIWCVYGCLTLPVNHVGVWLDGRQT